MKKCILPVLLLLIVCIVCPSRVLAEASLTVEGERAWLTANEASLAEVLALFKNHGAKVVVDPSIGDKQISGDWKNVKVAKLIGRLAAPHSYYLEWSLQQEVGGTFYKISSIHILPDGKPALPQDPGPTPELDIVEGENGIKYIRGEILVGFSEDATSLDLETLLEKIEGTLIETITPPGIYRIKLNGTISVEEAMRIAQAHRGVLTSEPNLAFPLTSSNVTANYSMNGPINQNMVVGETAVAVFDSGLDPAYADSPFILGTYNALDPELEVNDPTGHGTLTSLIAGGAVTPLGAEGTDSNVPVLSIQAFDKNGFTSSDTIMRALEYAANSGATIVSMSWGTETESQFLEAAMNFAQQNGMKLYASAGNEPTGNPVYPAAYESVTAVGGLNPDGSTWENSNNGSFVKHYEPATAVFNNQSYVGTSIASPYAAFKAAKASGE